MPEIPLLDWIHANPALLWWLGAASLAAFVGTLIAMPILVARIPPDYFVEPERRPARWARQHPIVRAALIGAKNALGGVLVVAGIAMLVLPGQGVLTMLVGLLLVDFPGKFRLERAIVRRRSVRRSIDWLRCRAGREPLRLDEPDGAVAPRARRPSEP